MVEGKGKGDRRVMPPELVGEVMDYCGTPILRMDGPSEQVATIMRPSQLSEASVDDGNMYYPSCYTQNIHLDRLHSIPEECCIRIVPKVCLTLKAWCYDAQRRLLFIVYSYYESGHTKRTLIGYSMAEKNVIMERTLYDLEERDFDKCSISAAGDFLYMAFARPAAIEVLYVQWSRSEDVKLVAAVEVDHRVGQTLLHASPSAPSLLDVLYMTNSVWQHVKLSMVRSDPFIKFEASRSMRAEAEGFEGRLIPILGSNPPLYVCEPTDGGTCYLRSAENLRKLAELDLDGGKLPAGGLIVDGRWTLRYLRKPAYYHNSFYLVWFHPYVNE